MPTSMTKSWAFEGGCSLFKISLNFRSRSLLRSIEWKCHHLQPADRIGVVRSQLLYSDPCQQVSESSISVGLSFTESQRVLFDGSAHKPDSRMILDTSNWKITASFSRERWKVALSGLKIINRLNHFTTHGYTQILSIWQRVCKAAFDQWQD